MMYSAERLAKLRNQFDDGKSLLKTDTITFQEAFKRCKRYINAKDGGLTESINKSYADKRRDTLEMIEDFVDTMKPFVDGFLHDTDDLKRALKDEIVNYGILTPYIDPANEDVDEIQINTLTEIFYTHRGVLRKLDKTFSSNNEVKKIIEKLIEKGERLNAETPFINARTVDGFRLNVTHPSISKNGTYGLTMRKQRSKPITEKDILNNLTVTVNMVKLMQLFARGRVNWATIGGTGSGKTVTNNVMLPSINPGLRCIYIENPTELRPEQYDKDGNIINNFLQLEAKNSDKPNASTPTMYNLLVNALRQTPDYIVPGEVRAPNEFEVALTAAQTGHNVFTTFHAEDAEDALFRFLNAVLKVSSAPAELVMRDICAAFRFIITVKRLADGSRKVMYISEVHAPDGLRTNITHLYKYVVDKVVEVVDEETGMMRPEFTGRHIRLNPISDWFQKKLQSEGVPRSSFDTFTHDVKFAMDEENNLVLDENLNPITLENEVEYEGAVPKYEGAYKEKMLELHKLRLERQKIREQNRAVLM